MINLIFLLVFVLLVINLNLPSNIGIAIRITMNLFMLGIGILLYFFLEKKLFHLVSSIVILGLFGFLILLKMIIERDISDQPTDWDIIYLYMFCGLGVYFYINQEVNGKMRKLADCSYKSLAQALIFFTSIFSIVLFVPPVFILSLLIFINMFYNRK